MYVVRENNNFRFSHQGRIQRGVTLGTKSPSPQSSPLPPGKYNFIIYIKRLIKGILYRNISFQLPLSPQQTLFWIYPLWLALLCINACSKYVFNRLVFSIVIIVKAAPFIFLLAIKLLSCGNRPLTMLF